jgi:hypothetical protein
MMGAAENLQHQIDAASFLKDPLQASLATLVAQIEEMVPELDQDKKDIDSNQALLTEAEAAYQAKAAALTDAKAKLTRAMNDMAHATLKEQRAASRAETARAVAGLSSGSDSGSGINVALDEMTRTAQATRDRAAALDMKAKALSGAKTAEEDPNIAAAMAAAAGTVANATVADRFIPPRGERAGRAPARRATRRLCVDHSDDGLRQHQCPGDHDCRKGRGPDQGLGGPAAGA